MLSGGTTITGVKLPPARPDIVFAYANAFGHKNDKDEFIPFSER